MGAATPTHGAGERSDACVHGTARDPSSGGEPSEVRVGGALLATPFAADAFARDLGSMRARHALPRMHSSHRRSIARRGFTLAEMMVVIVIIGLLATLVVPNVISHYVAAAREKARADIAQLVNALNEYAVRNSGRFPDSLEALSVPDENGQTYLQGRKPPLDPWKHEYTYEAPPAGMPDARPRVSSNGPDGQSGGGDDVESEGAER